MTCRCFVGLCVGLNVCFFYRKGIVNTGLVERVEMRGDGSLCWKGGAAQRNRKEDGIVF